MKAARWKSLSLVLVVLSLVLVSCNTEAESQDSPEVLAEEAAAPSSEDTEEEPQEAEAPAEEETANAEAEEDPGLPPLPADVVELVITMEDGRALEAKYYPAAHNPAPIIVLMHWAGGDIGDWDEIAPWLQNRGLGSAGAARARGTQVQGLDPWMDPSWFPEMPEDASFGVLSFSFGDFGNSPAGPNIPENWMEEALAAIQTASELEGVDATQIAALGASIGADGAVDGCYLFNETSATGQCVGALSLSPGDYLTTEFTYAEAVTSLDEREIPVWCLTAEGDIPSYVTCGSAEGTHYQQFIYAGAEHGMRLVRPDAESMDPATGVDTLVLIQDFLELVFGIALN